MTPQATKAFFSVDIFQLLIYHIYYINFLSLILPPDIPGTVNVAPINSKINKKKIVIWSYCSYIVLAAMIP